MSAMTAQITSLTIVYLTVYSGADQMKHQSSASLCARNSPVTGHQRASNAGNVSIWWRHHDANVFLGFLKTFQHEKDQQEAFPPNKLRCHIKCVIK